MDPDVARKNLRWGFVLFGLALTLFAGSIVVAVIYDAVNS
jgi:hypothetical protein